MSSGRTNFKFGTALSYPHWADNSAAGTTPTEGATGKFKVLFGDDTEEFTWTGTDPSQVFSLDAIRSFFDQFEIHRLERLLTDEPSQLGGTVALTDDTQTNMLRWSTTNHKVITPEAVRALSDEFRKYLCPPTPEGEVPKAVSTGVVIGDRFIGRTWVTTSPPEPPDVPAETLEELAKQAAEFVRKITVLKSEAPSMSSRSVRTPGMSGSLRELFPTDE